MTSTTMRVPQRVYDELSVAARLQGCDRAELVAAAWAAYKINPEFVKDLEDAQKAFAQGDLEVITNLMIKRAAQSSVDRIRADRD